MRRAIRYFTNYWDNEDTIGRSITTLPSHDLSQINLDTDSEDETFIIPIPPPSPVFVRPTNPSPPSRVFIRQVTPPSSPVFVRPTTPPPSPVFTRSMTPPPSLFTPLPFEIPVTPVIDDTLDNLIIAKELPPLPPLPQLPQILHIDESSELTETETDDEFDTTDESEQTTEQFGITCEDTDEELLTCENMKSLIGEKLFCVEDGKMYVWNIEQDNWEGLFDLFEWNHEINDWIEFRGDTEDACEHLGFVDVKYHNYPCNTETKTETKTPYKILNDEQPQYDCNQDETIPLLSDYDICSDDTEEKEWIPNPVYRKEEARPDRPYILEEYQAHQAYDIYSSSELCCDCQKDSDEYDLDEDSSSIGVDYISTESLASIDSCSADLYTTSESDSESDTENLIVVELYDKWLNKQYTNSKEKFGISGKLSFGDMYTKYQSHIDEFNTAPKLFYNYKLSQKIKTEIENVYDELIAQFLTNIFIKCDYRFRDHDMIICNSKGIDICHINEFVVKYLDLINREGSCLSIVDRLVTSPLIPHIATIQRFGKIKIE